MPCSASTGGYEGSVVERAATGERLCRVNESLATRCMTDALGQCLTWAELIDAIGFDTRDTGDNELSGDARRCTATDGMQYDVFHTCGPEFDIDCDSSDDYIFDTSGSWLAIRRRLDSLQYPTLDYCCSGQRTSGVYWGQDIDVDCTGDGLVYDYTWRDFVDATGETGSR